MAHTYWRKQTQDEPLFPDILWSRPETKGTSGKLAIIGGDSHGFSAPGIAYGAALDAGAGVCKVLLPDGIRKLVRGVLPDAEYGPSTPSGSFSKQAFSNFVDMSSWADTTLLAGDIGRNSETAMLLEGFVNQYRGPLVIAQDAVDYFKETPLQITSRKDTLVVLSLSQLQKLFIATPSIIPVTYTMTTRQLIEALHTYTSEHQACIITKHNDLLFVAQDGALATQKHETKIWRTLTAARASVFWMQNPNSLFEAAVSSLIASKDDEEAK